MEAGFDPASGRWLDPGEIGVDGGEHCIDRQAEDLYRADADYGDQADEHAVLDQGRALLVLGETADQLTQFTPLLHVEQKRV